MTWNFVRIGFQPRWSQIWSPIHNRTSRSVRNRVQNHFLEVLKCRYPFYKGVKYPFVFNLKGFINGVQKSKSQNAKAKRSQFKELSLQLLNSRTTSLELLASWIWHVRFVFFTSNLLILHFLLWWKWKSHLLKSKATRDKLKV